MAQSRPPIVPKRRVLIALTILLVAVGVYAARWFLTPNHTYGDSYQYLALSYDLAGQTQGEARLNAARYLCQPLQSSIDRDTCVENWLAIPERYFDIFSSRIGYPAVSAPFVAMFGPKGLTIGAAVLGVLWAVAFGYAIRESGGSFPTAFLAILIVFALPSGHWATAKLAEGGIYLGATTLLLGSLIAMRRSMALGLSLVVASMVWLGLTKSSSAITLGMAVVGAALLIVVSTKERDRRRRAFALGGVSAAASAAVWLVMMLLGRPGLTETLQDLYTAHFSSPDIENPLRRLLSELPVFLSHQAELLRDNPLGLVALLASLAGIAWMARRSQGHAFVPALLWAAIGLSGIPLILAHPVNSEIPRLVAVVWLPVAAGFAATITSGTGPQKPDNGVVG